ncbi:DUF5004 domain-containing protein [Flavobacterium sp.]|uniref:DUF5004 domain-containing protein n=1 Tax=Flavobacterium sp. TaxID=239 RepID=UPI00391B2282
MKQLLLFIFATINLGLSAQTEEYTGTYIFYVKAVKGEIIDYKLQLNSDKTFLYTSYINNNTNEYYTKGKGTWKIENKIIKFTTETSDLDKDHTLNFTGTTARVIKKSPRDTSDKVVPTSLQFYKSEIPTIANLKLLLKE